MGTGRYPDGASDEAAEESTVSDEDWPIAEQYRVEPPVALADDVATVVVSQDAGARPAPVRRFPPDLGRGVAAGLVGVLLLVLLIPAGIWLAARSDSEPTAAAVDGGSTQPPTTTEQQAPATALSSKTVPDATGRLLPQARDLVEGAGFRVRFERVASERPRDEVIRQAPESGAEVEPRSIVVLTISGGPDRIAVPDVEGMSASAAAGVLRDAGLDSSTRSIASDEQADTVLEQTPTAGEEVSKGTIVALRIAEERDTQPTTPQAGTVRVPDLVGTTSGDARSRLRAVGLRFTQRPVESQRPAGEVVSQSPRGGATLREGGTVTLRVSTGPPGAELPDVVGIDEAAAIRELETDGFVARVVDEPTFEPAEDGVVVAQSPPAGTTTRQGATVTITVARLS
jgi:beta-lactam-binding protein with PASTA domain